MWNNICVIVVSEKEDRDKSLKRLFEEIMVENFLNLGKEIHIQVQETQRVPSKVSPKKTILRHIIVKIVKIKGKERGRLVK